MSKKANPMAIGGFVLGALALTVVAILVFGSGALFREADKMVSYFPGTVQGLRVGAPVEFRGVQMGQVTDIKIDLFGDQDRLTVPVYFEIWPQTLRVVEGTLDKDRAKSYRHVIKTQGLRAKLESVSLVTGQYLVSLVMAPDTPANFESIKGDEDFIEIPSIPSTRDRIADMLGGLHLDKLVSTAIDTLDSVKSLTDDPRLKALAGNADSALKNADKLIADLDAGVAPFLKQVDGTLADYSQLAKDLGTRADQLAADLDVTLADINTLTGNLNTQVGPVAQSARGALGAAGKAFRSIDDLVGERSPTRYDLDLLLREGAGAARSLRMLADYLEQNPDALLKGKY